MNYKQENYKGNYVVHGEIQGSRYLQEVLRFRHFDRKERFYTTRVASEAENLYGTKFVRETYTIICETFILLDHWYI